MPIEPAIQEVATSVGTARLYLAPAEQPVAALVLGTGASGSVEALDLSVLPQELPNRGVSVVRVEQPWHVAGGRLPARPAVLDAGWRDALAVLAQTSGVGDVPLFTGGRSNGARVACRTTIETGAAGVVCLAFPLRPPGRRDQTRRAPTRLPELLLPDVPRLVLQGERDAFGSASQLRDAVGDDPGIRVVSVPGVDHAMRVKRTALVTQADVAELLVRETLAFCRSAGAA